MPDQTMPGQTGEPPLGAALAPLRARYASWLQLDQSAVLADRDEDPASVRALQLVLRLERDRSPSWHRALELACTTSTLVCLEPAYAEPVRRYCEGHIRKVSRRARGAQWQALDGLDQVERADGDTEVRAFVPGPVTELDKRIAKLQVGGTDLPVDRPDLPTERPDRPAGGPDLPADRPADQPEPSQPAEAELALHLYVPTEPVLSAGKLMAQTGHAGMIAAALLAATDAERLQQWWRHGCPARLTRLDPDDFRRRCAALRDPAAAWRQDGLLAVRDAGFTEVAPGTITVLAGV